MIIHYIKILIVLNSYHFLKLPIGFLDLPNVSGRMDFDYPSLADPKICLTSMKEIGHIKHVPLPDELTEQYGSMNIFHQGHRKMLRCIWM